MTNKNEIYKWEVLTGRLLQCIKDDNLYLNDMKITPNFAQHFPEFSVSVLVKDTATQVLDYSKSQELVNLAK